MQKSNNRVKSLLINFLNEGKKRDETISSSLTMSIMTLYIIVKTKHVCYFFVT